MTLPVLEATDVVKYLGTGAARVWNAGGSDALRLRLTTGEMRLLPERRERIDVVRQDASGKAPEEQKRGRRRAQRAEHVTAHGKSGAARRR